MEKKKLNKDILNLLENKDKNLQLDGLERIRGEGFVDYLPIIADLYLQTNKQIVRDKISAIFQDLKETDGVKVITSILSNTHSSDLRDMLLTACWSSSLDFSNYLGLFTELAVAYDYMVTFEVLTIVENFENTPPAAHRQEAVTRLKSVAAEESSSKREMLIELVDAIDSFGA